MKNRIILCLGCLLAFLQLRAQVNTNQQHLCNPNSFSIVLLGDPQNYVKYDYNQPVFELMTAWTAHHIDSLRVKAVLCTGDLVDQNECILPPFPRFGNLTSREQWTFVSRAFGRLDNKVPYLISTGNHDYGYTRSENSMTRFPEYFPIERNSLWRKTIVAATNNRNGLPTLENAAMEITDEHWGRILIIAVEFAPRDEVLSWARELVAAPRFKDHTVILITHSYLTGFDSKRITKEGYKITPSNTGEGIWQKLVQPSANIRLVLCGHYATPNERLDYTTGFRTDKNAAGHGYTRSENSMTRFPEYFPIERNSLWRKTIVAATNNRNGLPTLENAAMEITDEHWGRILIIAVEFAPRDEVLSWARELVAAPRFKDHTVILITHSYLTGFDSKRITKEGYKITPSNTGEGIWQKLVQPSANIRLVLCGHYATPNERLDYTTGFRTDKNAAGHDVHQMMFNCQALGGGMSGNGGDGWLRLLEFLPDGHTVQVRTYSPLFGFSPQTKDKAWRTESYDQFQFTIK